MINTGSSEKIDPRNLEQITSFLSHLLLRLHEPRQNSRTFSLRKSPCIWPHLHEPLTQIYIHTRRFTMPPYFGDFHSKAWQYIVLLPVISFTEVSKSLESSDFVGSRHLACWKRQTSGCGMELYLFVNGNFHLENGILLGIWRHYESVYMSQKWCAGENDRNFTLI